MKLEPGTAADTRRWCGRLTRVRCDGVAPVLDVFEVKNVLVMLAAPPHGMLVKPGGRSESEAMAIASRIGKVLRRVGRRYEMIYGGSLLQGTAMAGESVMVHGFAPPNSEGQPRDRESLAQLAYAMVSGCIAEGTTFDSGTPEFGRRLRAVAESANWDEALRLLDGQALPKTGKAKKRKKHLTFQRGGERELSARDQVVQEARERYKPKKWLIVLLYVLSSVIPIALYVLAHKGIIELPWMPR
jgi:hypothetical protein